MCVCVVITICVCFTLCTNWICMALYIWFETFHFSLAYIIMSSFVCNSAPYIVKRGPCPQCVFPDWSKWNETSRWHTDETGWRWKRASGIVWVISLLSLCFPQPSDTEQFHQRGQGFNASSGRYTAPVSGFYQLMASLVLGESVHSAHATAWRRAVWVKADGYVHQSFERNKALVFYKTCFMTCVGI